MRVVNVGTGVFYFLLKAFWLSGFSSLVCLKGVSSEYCKQPTSKLTILGTDTFLSWQRAWIFREDSRLSSQTFSYLGRFRRHNCSAFSMAEFCVKSVGIIS